MKNWLLPNRDQVQFLPPTIDDLLPENHLARFVVDVVERLDLSPILSRYSPQSHGSAPFHPALLLSLLFYGYATGVFSSRKIERATHDLIAFRFIAGGLHPDHDTIADFRGRFLDEIDGFFTQVLRIAHEMGMVKCGAISLDGTKIQANASKHSAVSYEKGKEIVEKIKQEVARLRELAAQADNTPVAEGLDIPKEIVRRQKRIEKIQEALGVIAERAVEKAAEADREAREKEALRAKTDQTQPPGEAPPPPPPATKTDQPPPPAPKPKDQCNFTDPDSRIMPDKGGFTQAYNAQLSVNHDSRMIVGHHVTQHTNDKKELAPALKAVDPAHGKPPAACCDAGFFSEEAIKDARTSHAETEIYAAAGRQKHGGFLDQALESPQPAADDNATEKEKMIHKLRTAAGREIYRFRKMTVEPVIGIIKSALGFRRFSLRGLKKVQAEWGLACLGYNLKRMFTLKEAEAG